MCRWSGKEVNEIKAGQSDAQTSSAETGSDKFSGNGLFSSPLLSLGRG